MIYEVIIFILGFAGLCAGALLLWRIPYCLTPRNSHVPELSVSIIIPARNEESTLPIILGSIRSRNGYTGEVIVVDDHSTDNTAAVARSFGTMVVTPSPLPEGWTGKTWACSQGAERATGDILVFLDADTFIYPGGLEKMIDTFLHEPGVVSILPYHTTQKLHEQFSAVFAIIVAASVNAFSLSGSHTSPTGLFGPCLMVKRKDYTRVGGHESVKGRILEHFFMAETFKRHGIEMACYGGRGVLSYRMYPEGIGQLIRGWGKAFAAGAKQTKRLTTLLISLWFAGNLIVPVMLGIGAVLHNHLFVSLMLSLYMGFVVEHYRMLKRLGSFFAVTAFLFPVTVCFFLFVFFRSLIRNSLGANVEWKGRTVNA